MKTIYLFLAVWFALSLIMAPLVGRWIRNGRRPLPLFILLLSALACCAQTASVTLAWDWAGVQTPSVSWNVYQTTNLTPPVAWTMLTNSTHKTASVQVLKQAQFFTVTTVDSSNFWRESDICPPAAITDNPPPGPQNVSVKPGSQVAAKAMKLRAPKAR